MFGSISGRMSVVSRMSALSREFIRRLQRETPELSVSFIENCHKHGAGARGVEALEGRLLMASQQYATLIEGGAPANDVDGALTVSVDPYGAFSHRFSASGAVFNPAGGRRPQETVNSSALFFSPLGNFLTTDSVITNNHALLGANGLPGGAVFVSQTHDAATDVSVAVSKFMVPGAMTKDGITYLITLTQTLTPFDATSGRATLTQQYEITNMSAVAATNVSLDHYLSSELDWDSLPGGIPLDTDTGGRSGDGRILYAFDSPGADAAYVSIRNDDPNGTGLRDGTYNGEAEFNPNLIVASHIEEVAKNVANTTDLIPAPTLDHLERPQDLTFANTDAGNGYTSANPLDNQFDNSTFPSFFLGANGNTNNLTFRPETYWPTILQAGGIANNSMVTYSSPQLDPVTGFPLFDPVTGLPLLQKLSTSISDLDTFPADRGGSGNIKDGLDAVNGSEGDNHLDDNSLGDAGPLSLTTQDTFLTILPGHSVTYTTRTDWGTRSTVDLSPGVFNVATGNVVEPPGDPRGNPPATGVARAITVTRSGSLGIADIGISSFDLTATSFYPDGSPPDYRPLGIVNPATETVPGDPSTGTPSGFTTVHFHDGQTTASLFIMVLPDLTIEGDEQIGVNMYANFPIKDGTNGDPHFFLSAFVNPITGQPFEAGTVALHDPTANDQQAFPTFWNVEQKQAGEPTNEHFVIIHIPANDDPGTIAFVNQAATVSQSAGFAHVQIQRVSNPNSPLDPAAQVEFTFRIDPASTAIAGLDYGTNITGGTNPDGSVTFIDSFDPATLIGTGRFAIPDITATIDIPIIGNLRQGSDTIIVDLTSAAPATVGIPNQETITIANDAFPGNFQFATSTVNVQETTPSITITATRTNGNTSIVDIPVVLTNGSAVQGVNFGNPSTAVFHFDPANGSTASVTIPIIHDGVIRPTLSFTASFGLIPGGGAPGSPASEAVNILDEDTTSQVQFSAPTYSVRENGGTATITVTRSVRGANGTLNGPATIHFATSGGTAVAGQDYSDVNGDLSFASGETVKTFTVPIIDNQVIDGARTINLTLSNPGGTSALGDPNTAVLTINDNDSSFQFSPANYVVNENAGTVTLTVTRAGDSTNPASVNFSTFNEDAIAGTRYVAASGSLTFNPGETSRTFSVQLIDDVTEINPAENFGATLSSPSGDGAHVASPVTANVQVLDVDRSEPVVTSVTIGAPSGSLERIILKFSKPLTPSTATSTANYKIFTADANGRFTKQVRVSAALYNASSRTVTLLPLPRIAPNTTLQVTVRGPGGIADTSGRFLAPSVAGTPSNFTARVAFGNKITYTDHKGNRVTLSLTGKRKGTMIYTAATNPVSETLQLINAFGDTLTGSIKGFADGVTELNSVTGANGVTIKLNRSHFKLDSVS
jgi:hypothetical protein